MPEEDLFENVHLVPRDRCHSAAHVERPDRGAVIGDGVVIGGDNDLHPHGCERTNAILEAERGASGEGTACNTWRSADT